MIKNEHLLLVLNWKKCIYFT